MKDMEYIEEMLNSYLDGELDERKSNEIRRLIDNDQQIRQFFDSLNRYKKLVGSVAPAKAPEGFCDGVSKRLERQVLLADTDVYHYKAGKRHLILRRVLTIAAVIALLAMLSAVVFDIFVPKSSREKLVSSVLSKKQKTQVMYEKPFAEVKPAENEAVPVPVPKVASVPLVVKLTLLTDSPVETDWLIGKALTNTGLFENTIAVDRKTDSVKYVLSCGRDSLVSLLGELSFIWPKCTDATLQVGTEQAGRYITVSNITVQQVLEICKADNYNQRIRMANDIAVINNAAAADVLKKYFARQNTNDLSIPDKPVLASTEKTVQAKSNVSAEPTNLTIVVIGE